MTSRQLPLPTGMVSGRSEDPQFLQPLLTRAASRFFVYRLPLPGGGRYVSRPTLCRLTAGDVERVAALKNGNRERELEETSLSNSPRFPTGVLLVLPLSNLATTDRRLFEMSKQEFMVLLVHNPPPALAARGVPVKVSVGRLSPSAVPPMRSKKSH